jgi:hypothetical protein
MDRRAKEDACPRCNTRIIKFDVAVPELSEEEKARAASYMAAHPPGEFGAHLKP